MWNVVVGSAPFFVVLLSDWLTSGKNTDNFLHNQPEITMVYLHAIVPAIHLNAIVDVIVSSPALVYLYAIVRALKD
jgi:hypothetical protein